MVAESKQFNTVRYLADLVAGQRLSHAYAFVGIDQQVKKHAAKVLAQHMACPHFEDSRSACFECTMCRRIEADEVADVIWLEPDGRQIKVNQIRELKQWTLVTPVELDFKMAVIQQADTMNVAAANALLQVLEEPLTNIYFILMVNDESSLLPTIRSRVQVVQFKQPSEQERLDRLQTAGISKALQPYLVNVNADVLDRLLDLVDADAIGQYIQDVLTFYKWVVAGDAMAFVGVQTVLKPYLTGELSKATADYIEMINRDVLVELQKNHQQREGYVVSLLKDITIEPQNGLRLNEALIELKQAINFNVPAQLAFEKVASIMIQWAQV